ncbi:hypothetical protein BVG19_g1968 [[Candida] boidinii]|nr:hypothetical protein BVG19_g1968 [[Candida] boidinii]OWB49430.1 hypothetical protein B5S27_g971 [[Candida] boidinii]
MGTTVAIVYFVFLYSLSSVFKNKWTRSILSAIADRIPPSVGTVEVSISKQKAEQAKKDKALKDTQDLQVLPAVSRDSSEESFLEPTTTVTIATATEIAPIQAVTENETVVEEAVNPKENGSSQPHE